MEGTAQGDKPYAAFKAVLDTVNAPWDQPSSSGVDTDIETELENFKCQCGFETSSADAIHSHLVTHSSEGLEDYSCPVCNVRATDKSTFRMHLEGRQHRRELKNHRSLERTPYVRAGRPIPRMQDIPATSVSSSLALPIELTSAAAPPRKPVLEGPQIEEPQPAAHHKLQGFESHSSAQNRSGLSASSDGTTASERQLNLTASLATADLQSSIKRKKKPRAMVPDDLDSSTPCSSASVAPPEQQPSSSSAEISAPSLIPNTASPKQQELVEAVEVKSQEQSPKPSKTEQRQQQEGPRDEAEEYEVMMEQLLLGTVGRPKVSSGRGRRHDQARAPSPYRPKFASRAAAQVSGESLESNPAGAEAEEEGPERKLSWSPGKTGDAYSA